MRVLMVANFIALLKKEFKVYLNSFIVYATSTIFLLLSGYFFFTAVIRFDTFLINQRINITEGLFRQFFMDMDHVICLTIPLLTMRLFSEEKKSGTIELLLTYPVRDMEIILAKFFACVSVYTLMLSLTAVYPYLLSTIWDIEVAPVLSGYLALFLIGCACISLGMLISSFTRDQIVAAMVTFGVILLFLSMAFSAGWAGPVGQKILIHLSFLEHSDQFAQGVIDTRSIVHCIVFTVCFMLFTYESLRSRLWRGPR
jgi:ABC-2 type transport system permease protein